jgi:hypothetical protein
MAKRETNPAGKARAAAIHAEIDELTGAAKNTSDKNTPREGAEPGTSGEKTPLSPRDFIQRWMAEHDKKAGEK